MTACKKPVRQLAILLGASFLLYLAVVRLDMACRDDVLLAATALPPVTQTLYLAVELIAFFIVYAFVIFAAFRCGIKQTLVLCSVYAALTLTRHVALLFIEYSVYRISSVGLWTRISLQLGNVALELLQLGVILLPTVMLARSFDKSYAVIRSGSERLGLSCPTRESLLYPRGKSCLSKDFIRRSALIAAAVVCVTRVVSRLLYDIAWGAPSDVVDALWMVAYYTLDILVGVLSYFTILLVIRRLDRSQEGGGEKC